MKKNLILAALVLSPLVLGAAARPACGQRSRTEDKPPAKLAHIVAFDFLANEPKAGASVADRLRLRMRRHREYAVVDRITTQEFSGPLGIDTGRQKVVSLMKQLAANVAFYGTVTATGQDLNAVIRCVDLRRSATGGGWTKTFSDNTQRRHGLIARWIVEAFTGSSEWVPPQYGDVPVPKNLRKPVNVNGTFDAGSKGWNPPDNATSFIEQGPKGRGKILRIRNTSMAGFHFRSEWIKATPGWRYWLAADFRGPGSKIFVKGFREGTALADGLSQSALARLGLTPRQFSNLPEKRRKYLIAQEAKNNPASFRRECYRWYMSLGGGKSWGHMTEVVPPRGGLPKNVQWLRIDIYPYWPPGTYYYDNVHLYKDPNQKAPMAEAQPRTPDYSKPGAIRQRAKGPKK